MTGAARLAEDNSSILLPCTLAQAAIGLDDLPVTVQAAAARENVLSLSA